MNARYEKTPRFVHIHCLSAGTLVWKDGVATYEPYQREPPAAQYPGLPPEPAPATPASIDKTELLVHGAGKSECNGRLV